jgi:RNA polymerase sigma-70 factor (ECF subfamily)
MPTEINDNLMSAPGDEPDQQSLMKNDLAFETMEEALKELNQEQRQCVTLFYLERRSYQEIHEITGFTLLQVKSYIQNGKRNLRILIEKKMKESPNN